MNTHSIEDMIVDATLYTLIVFSAITWTLILYKTWQFAKSTRYNKRFNRAFWEVESLQEAEQLSSYLARGPKARIAASGFNWLTEQRNSSNSKRLKFRGSVQELLEQALRKKAIEEQRKIESGLTMLASIGSTAPFVGLFGTVLGIMHAMRHISETGSASLDVVAGPIGEALIATAIGIAVAVPAVLAYNFFLRQAKHLRTSLEHFIDGYVHIVFVEQASME
jgi:biopolymer transport protein ExbB